MTSRHKDKIENIRMCIFHPFDMCVDPGEFGLCFTTSTFCPSSQARVSETLANPSWAEHFSRGGGMTLSTTHSSCTLFTNAFHRLLTLMKFWKADLRSWNRKGCCQPIMLPLSRAVTGRTELYPNKESSLIINDASFKKYSAQAYTVPTLVLLDTTVL